MSATHGDPVATVLPGVSARLRGLELGAPLSVSGLDVTPLLAPEDGPRGYRLLHEAAADLAIEEVAAGQVNRITVLNRGEKPVLILEGQTVTGAKQNRVVTVTVMVPGHGKVELDVGCVERDRWSTSFGAFAPGESSVAPAMRRGTVREAKHTGEVNQGRLWKDVEILLASHGAAPPTADYVSLLETQRREVEERARLLEPRPRQVGALVLGGGRLVAMELLGHADAWREAARRLMTSYLLEAEWIGRRTYGARPGRGGEWGRRAPGASSTPSAKAEPGASPSPGAGSAPGAGPTPPPATAAEWLESIAGASTSPHPAVGLGVRIALEGPGPRNETLHGAGLWFGDRPVHLAAFAEGDRR